MNCRFSDAAATELGEAFDFYRQHSADLGQQFVNEIIRGVNVIADATLRWAEIQSAFANIESTASIMD